MEILIMSVRDHFVFLSQNAGRILLDPAVSDSRFSDRSRGRQIGRERQIMRLKRKHIRVGLPTARYPDRLPVIGPAEQ